VKRELVDRGWVGYIYIAEKPARVIEKIKAGILGELEKLERAFVD